MTQALSIAPQPPMRYRDSSSRERIRSPSPVISRTSLSASVSPPPHRPNVRARSSFGAGQKRSSSRSSESKENIPHGVSDMDFEMSPRAHPVKANGKLPLTDEPKKYLREGSVDSQDSSSNMDGGGMRRKVGTTPRSVRSSKSPFSASETDSIYNGLPTLETVPDDGELPAASTSTRPPPPASSTSTAMGDRPVTRKRRSSSIKRKPSPGVTPTKAVDWEIPRKTLHSSIGFLTLLLNHLNPPSLTPLISVLSAGLVTIGTADFFRLHFPAFAEIWELWLGFLMRESERQKVNGVIWYLIGVIFVLAVYPRDVAVIAILTLSWSDTTASTLGRLWGKYTPPLPPHFPGVKLLKFAPRKSLAGFIAATVTGALICLGFWAQGSGGRWKVVEGTLGWLVTAGVVGLGGAVTEALDAGLDDNLTLPIMSGALVWGWLGATNAIL